MLPKGEIDRKFVLWLVGLWAGLSGFCLGNLFQIWLRAR